MKDELELLRDELSFWGSIIMGDLLSESGHWAIAVLFFFITLISLASIYRHEVASWRRNICGFWACVYRR